MTNLFAAFFLVAGAAICLLAAIGVLRLPDFFMRMHAATKAGVAGCGLVLIGVALAAPSVGMWIKVALAIVFLLLTTPVAGHLLGRSGYVAGVPLWRGTKEDQLSRELRRGDFEQAVPATAVAPRSGGEALLEVRRVVVGLADGPALDAAIRHAIGLARSHGAELIAMGIIDTRMLRNVGPVPIGGNYYAEQLRSSRIAKARRNLAGVIQRFEQVVRDSGLRFRVQLEEGDPVRILHDLQWSEAVLVIGRDAWFDQGMARRAVDPVARLARCGIGSVVGVSADGRARPRP